MQKQKTEMEKREITKIKNLLEDRTLRQIQRSYLEGYLKSLENGKKN